MKFAPERMRYFSHVAASVLFMVATPCVALSSDYKITFLSITDFERIRPLIDACSDLGDLERSRKIVELASDLESLRSLFEEVGSATFRRCPTGVVAMGVTELKDDSSGVSDYALTFRSISDLEKIRLLVEECRDLGTLERHRRQVEAAPNLEFVRNLFEQARVATFRLCPPGVTGRGISELQNAKE